MDAEVIKEFLVKINYKTDESSFRKFREGITGSTKAVMGLAAAMTAAATAVVAGVTRMSRGMEDLYYSSERLGSSVASINSVTYAASQMGTTAEEARGSLEGLAQRMRTNPGYGGLVRGLIGSGTDLSNTTAVFQRLGERFRSMPFFQANQYAQALGISEPVLQAMIRGLDRFGADYRRRLRLFGVDVDDAARIGQRLQQSYRQTASNFSILGDRIMVSLGPLVQKGFDDFNRWLERNHDKVVRFVEVILRAILRFGTAMGELFTDENINEMEGGITRVIESMEDFVKWFSDGTNAVDALKAALGLFLVYMAGSWAAGIIGVFTSVSTSIGGTFLGLLARRLLGAGGMVLIPSGGNSEADDLREFQANPEGFRRRMEQERREGTGSGTAPSSTESQITQQRLQEERQEQELRETIERSGANTGNVILDGLRTLFGFRPAAAAGLGSGTGLGGGGGGAATGTSAQDGVTRRNRTDDEFAAEFGPAADIVAGRLGVQRDAILAHWSLETHNGRSFAGGFNLGNLTGTASQNTTAGGDRDAAGNPITQRFLNFSSLEEFANYYAGWVERHAPDARGQNSALGYGAALSRGGYAANPAFPSSLNGVFQRLRRGNAGTMVPGAYLGPGPGQAGGPGGAGVTINQSTSINVNGAGNPAAVGQEVAGQQRRVNSDLERNTRGAVR